MTDSARPQHHVLEQAAEWFAVLRADDASADDRLAWQRWLDGAPAHRQAWRMVESVNAQFGALPAPVARRVLAPGEGASRRRALKALVMLCVAGGTGGLVAGSRENRDFLAVLDADAHTGTGEVSALALEDDSHAWLNTASAADLRYTGALRRIVLRRGELLVHTAADPRRRPLAVDCAHGRLLALGTRFAVRRMDGQTRLAVYDGAVRITTGGGAQQQVPAGFQVRFDAAGIGARTVVSEEESAWSRQLLIAAQMRLGDFLAELGRYRHGHLACDPALADLRLVGSYPLGDTDRALAMLEAALPVRVRHVLPWWVSVDPR